MHAALDQVGPDDLSLLGSTGCSVCATAGYTLCIGLTSIYVCASSLQNLAVEQDFNSSLSISVEQYWWFCTGSCGIDGF